MGGLTGRFGSDRVPVSVDNVVFEEFAVGVVGVDMTVVGAFALEVGDAGGISKSDGGGLFFGGVRRGEIGGAAELAFRLRKCSRSSSEFRGDDLRGAS